MPISFFPLSAKPHHIFSSLEENPEAYTEVLSPENCQDKFLRLFQSCSWQRCCRYAATVASYIKYTEVRSVTATQHHQSWSGQGATERLRRFHGPPAEKAQA